MTVKVLEILRRDVAGQGRDLGLIALNEYNLPVEFPKEVLASVDKLPAPKMDNRRDMTDLEFITIDPATAAIMMMLFVPIPIKRQIIQMDMLFMSPLQMWHIMYVLVL